MGVVEIPANPAGAGHLSCKLELDKDELRITLDRLKKAVELLRAGGGLASISAGLQGITLGPSTSTSASTSTSPPAAAAPQAPPQQQPPAAAPAVPTPTPVTSKRLMAREGIQDGPTQSMAPPGMVPAPAAQAPAGPPQSTVQQRPAAPPAAPTPPGSGPSPANGVPRPQAAPPPQAPLASAPPAGPRPQQGPAPALQPPQPAPQQVRPAATAPASRPAAPVAVPAAVRPPAGAPGPRPAAPPAPPPPGRAAAPPPAAPRPAAPAAPSPASSAARLPAWQLVFSTEAPDHNSEPVQAMAYCSALEGLPGGDGHGGWLISSSKGLLNLWECSAGGGRGQPSLMMLHSQMTDFLTTSLAAEPTLQILFGVSIETAKATELVSCNSLFPEAGFLAYKYRFSVPPLAQAPAPAPGARRQGLTKVVSLHPVGGQVRACCAASQGGQVLVLESAGLHGPGNQGKPRAQWKAHEAPITAMQCSAFTQQLVTGAADGSVCIWSLRSQLGRAPVLRLGHRAHVTSLQMANEQLLATGAADGKIVLWDLRAVSTPLKTLVPDGSPVLQLKTSPIGDCLAVSTQKGLHTVDLLDIMSSSPPVVAPISEVLPRPYVDIEWNLNTGEVYACNAAGTIAVFKPKVPF